MYFTFPTDTINKYFIWKRVNIITRYRSTHAPGTWELRELTILHDRTDSSTYTVLDSRTAASTVWDTVSLLNPSGSANSYTSSVTNLTDCLDFLYNTTAYQTYILDVTSNAWETGLIHDNQHHSIDKLYWRTRNHQPHGRKHRSLTKVDLPVFIIDSNQNR